MITGTISRISGPVITSRGMKGSKMYDVVKVGGEALRGRSSGLTGKKRSSRSTRTRRVSRSGRR